MQICLVAMFKNESHILNEWLHHYMKQGVDKFFLIDNDSNDNYLEHLQHFIDNNIVELVVDATKCNQSNGYNKHFLDKCKMYDWTIVCDLDEFIYARMGFATIKDYLHTVESSVSQVHIPWKMFGSNGYNTIEQEQPTSVIQAFTKRTNYNKESGFHGVLQEGNITYGHGKCIVRTMYLLEFNIHSHSLSNRNFSTSDNCDNVHINTDFSKINESILEKSCLHLNHYGTQSLNWFMKVKGTRGDAALVDCINMRTENYFNGVDGASSDIVDLELQGKQHANL